MSSGSDHVAVELIVSGRVQGVFYRAYARDRARANGLSGWAENRADGTVEVRLEGPSEAVEAVAADCHRGPERARVEAVERRQVAVEGLSGFEAR